jgi:predicted ATPase/class 3 adenylate cyclase
LPRSELPSGTVTFLFTDIEGSTRLLEKLGDDYVDALAEHRRLLRDAIEQHGGVEVDTQGDAFFVAFARAGDAVAAAEDGQRALVGGPVRVRMGIHTGEPLLTEEGYVGMDVHRAARIAAAGHGGQVLVSQTTRELLGDSPALRDLGDHRLKDLSAPQRLYQVGDGAFPPLKALNEMHLPQQPTSFVGRGRELAEVVELVRSSRLVALTGPGGSGKTRLALQAAAELADEFDDGVWFVPLAPVDDVELVAPTIAKALGVREDLEAHLRGKRALLLLDNLEHLLEAAPVVGELVAGAESVSVLATSRERLGLAAEVEYRLPTLASDEAVELFEARARALQPGFEPNGDVKEICERLDGLPLAIELAAARARILTSTQILERLGRRLELLTGGARDAPERQRTLRSTIEWSYELLDEGERTLFARLAVFGASFSLEAAEEVVEADLDALASLLDKSLLRETGVGRFFLLETLKEFAAERLHDGGDADAYRLRHAEWGLALAERAEPHLEGRAEQTVWLDALEAERDNLRTASATLRELGRGGDALRLVTALWRLWFMRGPVSEGTHLVETALEATPATAEAERARGLRVLGNFHHAVGDWEGAVALHVQALELSRRIGDEREEALALLGVGAAAAARGELELAKEHVRAAVRLAKKAGDMQRTVASATAHLGVVALHERDYPTARACFQDSLAAMGGEEFGTAVNLSNLAFVAFRLGDLPEAEARLRESLTVVLRLLDHLSMTHALEVLAAVLAARGEVALAARILGANAALREGAGLLLQELEAELHGETDALVRGQLTPAEFERELSVGHEAALDDLIQTAIARLD